MKITVKSTFVPQVDLQRSLAFEAESDPTIMDQEQTWPTAEELEQAQTEEHRRTKRVPKGTSAYQAAWIVSDEEDEAEDDDGKGRVDQNQVCSFALLALSLVILTRHLSRIPTKINTQSMPTAPTISNRSNLTNETRKRKKRRRRRWTNS